MSRAFTSEHQTSPSVLSTPADYDWPMFLHDTNHDGAVLSPAPYSFHLAGTDFVGINASGTDLVTSPAVSSHGIVFVGHGINNTSGGIEAINATSKKLWSLSVNGTVIGSPAVSNDTLYVTSTQGNITAVIIYDPNPKLWSYMTEVSSNPLRS